MLSLEIQTNKAVKDLRLLCNYISNFILFLFYDGTKKSAWRSSYDFKLLTIKNPKIIFKNCLYYSIPKKFNVLSYWSFFSVEHFELLLRDLITFSLYKKINSIRVTKPAMVNIKKYESITMDVNISKLQNIRSRGVKGSIPC